MSKKNNKRSNADSSGKQTSENSQGRNESKPKAHAASVASNKNANATFSQNNAKKPKNPRGDQKQKLSNPNVNNQSKNDSEGLKKAAKNRKRKKNQNGKISAQRDQNPTNETTASPSTENNNTEKGLRKESVRQMPLSDQNTKEAPSTSTKSTQAENGVSMGKGKVNRQGKNKKTFKNNQNTASFHLVDKSKADGRTKEEGPGNTVAHRKQSKTTKQKRENSRKKGPRQQNTATQKSASKTTSSTDTLNKSNPTESFLNGIIPSQLPHQQAAGPYNNSNELEDMNQQGYPFHQEGQRLYSPSNQNRSVPIQPVMAQPLSPAFRLTPSPTVLPTLFGFSVEQPPVQFAAASPQQMQHMSPTAQRPVVTPSPPVTFGQPLPRFSQMYSTQQQGYQVRPQPVHSGVGAQSFQGQTFYPTANQTNFYQPPQQNTGVHSGGIDNGTGTTFVSSPQHSLDQQSRPGTNATQDVFSIDQSSTGEHQNRFGSTTFSGSESSPPQQGVPSGTRYSQPGKTSFGYKKARSNHGSHSLEQGKYSNSGYARSSNENHEPAVTKAIVEQSCSDQASSSMPEAKNVKRRNKKAKRKTPKQGQDQGGTLEENMERIGDEDQVRWLETTPSLAGGDAETKKRNPEKKSTQKECQQLAREAKEDSKDSVPQEKTEKSESDDKVDEYEARDNKKGDAQIAQSEAPCIPSTETLEGMDLEKCKAERNAAKKKRQRAAHEAKEEAKHLGEEQVQQSEPKQEEHLPTSRDQYVAERKAAKKERRRLEKEAKEGATAEGVEATASEEDLNQASIEEGTSLPTGEEQNREEDEAEKDRRWREELKLQKERAAEKRAKKKKARYQQVVEDRERKFVENEAHWRPVIEKVEKGDSVTFKLLKAEFGRSMGIQQESISKEDCDTLYQNATTVFSTVFGDQISKRFTTYGVSQDGLNGRKGTVVSFALQDGKFSVALDTKQGKNPEMVMLQPKFLEPIGFKPGKRGKDPSYSVEIAPDEHRERPLFAVSVRRSDIESLLQANDIGKAIKKLCDNRAEEERLARLRAEREAEERQAAKEAEERQAAKEAEEYRRFEEQAEERRRHRQQQKQREKGQKARRRQHAYGPYGGYRGFGGFGRGYPGDPLRDFMEEMFERAYEDQRYRYDYEEDDYYGSGEPTFEELQEERNEAAELLGVDPDADTGTIKKAYHRLALVYHPDKFRPEALDDGTTKEEAIEKFKAIQNAYAYLTTGPDDCET